jgi:hypothetical protein
MTETDGARDLTDPRVNEAVWRAQDLLRAYASRDRAAIGGHLAHLEDDQLEWAGDVLTEFWNDVVDMFTGFQDAESLVRGVDAVAHSAPPEYEFAVTIAVRRLARGEAALEELVRGEEQQTRAGLHTLAAYTVAFLLLSLTPQRIEEQLDRAAEVIGVLGGLPRPYSVT